MYVATNEGEPFCGSFQYYFSLKINSNSRKTTGMISLILGNETIKITEYDI